jgi:hypothetical protein
VCNWCLLGLHELFVDSVDDDGQYLGFCCVGVKCNHVCLAPSFSSLVTKLV